MPRNSLRVTALKKFNVCMWVYVRVCAHLPIRVLCEKLTHVVVSHSPWRFHFDMCLFAWSWCRRYGVSLWVFIINCYVVLCGKVCSSMLPCPFWGYAGVDFIFEFMFSASNRMAVVLTLIKISWFLFVFQYINLLIYYLNWNTTFFHFKQFNVLYIIIFFNNNITQFLTKILFKIIGITLNIYYAFNP